MATITKNIQYCLDDPEVEILVKESEIERGAFPVRLSIREFRQVMELLKKIEFDLDNTKSDGL